jgi:hypothetical protein
MKRDDPEVLALAEEILRYLAAHPDAADTREHIERWWILRQRIEDALAATQQALDYLEKRGAVRKTGQGGSAVYSLAREARKSNGRS